jgi:Domain of unknown function (DUF4266)
MTKINAANTTRIALRAVATLAALIVTLGAATGCAPVAPYERGKLAHPTMAAADLTGFGESHLRAISEGATGGSGGTGSGCGCN